MNSNTKKFSIIIPIYNTGKYLQSAINSLVNQTLDFNDNVEIILVNDGSTDKSEQICRKIIQNYPDNIKYIYKENGGVASARNVGIQVAEGEWLGFLDPDDTYSLNTLSELQNGILRWPNIKLFSIPMFTFEREKKSHRLNYKFGEDKIVDIDMEPEAIQLSSASTFVNKSIFNNYLFPEQLPVGEDMVFNNRIFSTYHHYGLLAKPRYHYRKRYDKSSIMDNIEESKERYVPYIKNAILKEIPNLLSNDKLSNYHQNVFLYEISGKIKQKVRPQPIQKDIDFEHYLKSIWEVLQYIDEDTIISSRFLDTQRKYVLLEFKKTGNLTKLSNIFNPIINEARTNVLIKNKQGNILKSLSNVMLNVTNFKPYKDNIQVMGYFETLFDFEQFDVYFENNKKEKIRVNLSIDTKDNCYFIGEVVKEIFKFKVNLPLDFLNKKVYLIVKDRKSNIAKKIHLNFIGRKCRILRGVPGSYVMLEQNIVYYEKHEKSLKITKNKEKKEYLDLLSNIFLEKYKSNRRPWSIRDIRNLLPYVRKEYEGKTINIFMDRVLKADDNAEALIKYFDSKKNKQVLNYFVLSQNSPDFERLTKEGISVIPYGSFDHLKLLLVAGNLIVSQMAWAVVEPFHDQYGGNIKDLFKHNLIFLQHGVIMCDVSQVLKKSKVDADLFVTSAYPEKEEISREAYEYSQEEIILTGLPRHDNLTKDKGNYIAVMPTWSREVVSQNRKNDLREAIPNFTKTGYYKKWNNILNDKRLLSAAKAKGYEIIFIPHPEIRGSVEMFNLENVLLAEFDARYVDIINNSSCVITDRSSVFMDFGYAGKEVFYYGPHDNNNYDDGYFNFEEDGFGPVSYDLKTLVSQIIQSMDNDFELSQKYVERRNRFFAFDDSRNSERVYNEIQALTSYNKEPQKVKQHSLAKFLKKVINK